MIASPGRRLLAACLCALVASAATACRTPAGGPLATAFRPPTRTVPPEPNVADTAAVDVARAALLSNGAETAQAVRRLQAIETILDATDERSTGLLPVSLDLRNTLVDDNHYYRQATDELLDRDDLNPVLRKRLELYDHDDPLLLARDRIYDYWWLEFGRVFNALVEPVGRSIMTTQLAPYRLGKSLLKYAVDIYRQEALTIHRRQALAHWKHFLREHPDKPEAAAIRPKVAATNNRWHRLHRDRSLKTARRALDAGRVRLALVYADRALRHSPEDAEASRLRDEAAARLLEIRDGQRRSLDAAAVDTSAIHPREQRSLAIAMLLPDGDVAGRSEELAELDPAGTLADEAAFARATALGEAGQRDAMFEVLAEIAEAPDSNMARHARAELHDPHGNSYAAWQAARKRNYWDRGLWVLFGPYYRGIGDKGLPGPAEWVLEATSVAESVFSTPFRLINLPWAQSLPSEHRAAIHAREHLERHPDGAHSQEVRSWLEGFESKRGNWTGALELARQQPDPDVRELAEMREKAAVQYLEAAMRHPSRSMRLAMYQRMAADFPGTAASRDAGILAREEIEHASAQHIRLTRGFLEENPSVAGPEGLALRRELLDDEPLNAELHPEGVALLGGHTIEVSYLANSGNPKDPPTRVRERIADEHLARAVSQLEETTYRNELLDPFDAVGPDATRDAYFERVRLGLAEGGDKRLSSASEYTYKGMSERYGMVRARESILPFDIIVQGNLSTLSLGAWPRIRPPRQTPDAFLYR